MIKYLRNYFLLFTTLLFFFLLSNKTCYSKSPLVKIKNVEHSFYLETNYLLYMLGLSYDYTNIIDKKHGWSFSAGISTIDSKSRYILPPNIGIPISASYMLGKRHNFVEIGVNLRPQFYFTKDYVHHDHFNFRTVLKENTNLVYLAPKIGFRHQSKRHLCYKISVGPQFKIVESDYTKYTEEVFKDFNYLETLNIQISVGFILE